MRRFRAAAEGVDPDRMLAEGHRLVAEALTAGLTLEEAAWSPRLLAAPGGADLQRRVAAAAGIVHACTDAVLERLSRLDSHQGVAVVLQRPKWTFDEALFRGTRPLFLVAAAIRDPGNLGALVRCAEAAGARGVLIAENTADPWRDKALRGSAGSAFRLPCITGMKDIEAIASLRRHGLRIVVAETSSPISFWEADLSGPTAIVVGAEGGGVPMVFRDAADLRVGIPLADPVESLNVAVAAGILLFEARRQRG